MEMKIFETVPLIQYCDIYTYGKSSQDNDVTLEKIIKRAWRVISYGNLVICKRILNFESMFSYFIGVKFYKIIRLDCHP